MSTANAIKIVQKYQDGGQYIVPDTSARAKLQKAFVCVFENNSSAYYFRIKIAT